MLTTINATGRSLKETLLENDPRHTLLLGRDVVLKCRGGFAGIILIISLAIRLRISSLAYAGPNSPFAGKRDYQSGDALDPRISEEILIETQKKYFAKNLIEFRERTESPRSI
jgi:hypothetical protein